MIDHIIDQIWTQYDYDNSGNLEGDEAYDFLKTVLLANEKMLAQASERDPKEISDEDVRKAFKNVDTNKDGFLTKVELAVWIKDYMTQND